MRPLAMAVVVYGAWAANPVNVSTIDLIANGKKYHKQVVRVVGYVNLEFEGNHLYPTHVDHDHGLLFNSIWLDVNRSIETNRLEFHHKYVVIEGVFDVKDTGHMGVSRGTIKNILRFQTWSDPSNPRNKPERAREAEHDAE